MGKLEKVPGVGAYGGPAGGWGALQAVARALRAQMALNRETRALRRVNQPQGFDCPGCAWPDPRHASSFEFCENGAKAVAWEATRKRADLDFFAAHTVSELWNWTDFALEDAGRLAHPMIYDAASDHFVPHRLGGCVRPHRRRAAQAPRSEHGGVLHLRAHLERSGVHVPGVRARVRHQQLPRLLQHVPRGDQRRPAGFHRRRQRHGHARRLRPCRPRLLHGPQPRHQPSAHAVDAARCVQARRHDRGVQPAEGARPRALPVAAAPGGNADAGGRRRSRPSTTRCASAATRR